MVEKRIRPFISRTTLVFVWILFSLSCNVQSEKEGPKVSESVPEGDSLINRAGVFTQSSDYLSAQNDLLRAYAISVERNNPYLALKTAYQGALLSTRRGDYSRAIGLLNYCLKNGKNLDKEIYINSFIHLSYLHQSLDNPWLSMAYLYEALDQSQKLKNETFIRNCQHHLGLTLYQLQQYTEARKHFTKSLSYFKNKKLNPVDALRKQEQLGNIGLTYYKEGFYTSALLYMDSAQDYIENRLETLDSTEENQVPGFVFSIALKQALGVISGNKAQVYRELGEYETADGLMKKSLFINGHPGGEFSHAATVALDQLELYVNNMPNKLTNELVEADRALILKYGSPSLKNKYYSLMIKLNRRLGKDAQALNYQDSLSEFYSAKVSFPERGVKYEDILVEMGFLKQGQLLRDTKEELATETYQKKYILISAILVFLLLIIMIYLYKEDVKRRKHLEAIHFALNAQTMKLEDANSELSELNAEKNHILAVVAHDLRNPLSTIKGLGKLIMSDELTPEELKQYMSYVETSNNKAMDIINDLLEVANLDSGIEPEMSIISLRDALMESFELMLPKAIQKGITFTFDSCESPALLLANKSKFVRAIDNLLSNSIKFSYRNCSILLKLSSQDLKHTIEIIDTGIGMNKEQLTILFDRFTKAGRYGTEGEISHGMGMSIVKKIVEMHHGTIDVVSEEGKGTTVTLTFQG